MYKKNDCNSLREVDVNKKVCLQGFVHSTRKLGKLIFIDLRDQWGITQLVVDSEKFLKVRNEDVIEVIGQVKKRKDKNPKLKTGGIELKVIELKVLSRAKTPPFIIKDETDGLENLRLQYRFLDLRRPQQKYYLIQRSKIINQIREFFNKNGFTEIETPILSKPTPEGARDFIVPSYLHPNDFFALPQSPQIYKQLLIASGFEKYFQIARCFRDEALRSDRQPEFTQLDIETAFHSKEEIMNYVEMMLIKIASKYTKKIIKKPFPILTYDEAIKKYASDKPDTRFDMFVYDVSKLLEHSKLKLFSDSIKKGLKVKAIFLDQILNEKQIKDLTNQAKKNGAKGLAYYCLKKDDICGTIGKHIDQDSIVKLQKIEKHVTAFFIIDEEHLALNVAGNLRYFLGNKILNLTNPKQFNFVWIVDWPLFIYENNKLVLAHHPFTLPQKGYSDLTKAKANSYDIVLNGVEIGGGTIRINDLKLQLEIFKMLKLTPEQIKNQFGFFLESFEFGLPPHGGIALGVDRLIAMLLNTNSIRDVIAFPKNSHGKAELEKAPSKVASSILDELKLKVV